MFKKIIWTSLLLTLLVSSNVYAQQTGTPATLRVRIDANGYLLLSATSQTNPVTTSVFGQARIKTDASGNLLVVLTGGGSGAPANGPYITFTANATLTGAQNVGLLSTGLLLNTVSAASGTVSRYAGSTCTNQAITALNNSGAATCTTLTSAYVNNSIALTGTDINTSNQVTATHLAAALPINQGGTNATSASITAFNNITGLSAAGTTGTTSTNLVFSTSPTLVTPILGTPQSVNLTNGTALPTTGLTGTITPTQGGCGTSLAATGGTSQVLKQTSVGGNCTVAQLAASDISDYATGTWVPIDSSGASLTFTYPKSSFYTKIGKLVCVTVSLTFPSTADTNPVSIGGLPFTSANAEAGIAVGVSSVAGFAVAARVRASATTIGIDNILAAAVATNANVSSATFVFGGCYITP